MGMSDRKVWPTLYSKGSKGETRVWNISVEGNHVTIMHGVKGGKIVTKTTQSFGKNKGRSNETTDHTQALNDAEAKFVKQQKKNYFLSEDEAMNSVDLTPMLLHKWDDHKHKITYPAYIQVKVDGLRALVDKDLNAWSRAKEPYTMPKHIQDDLSKIKSLLGDAWHGLDGEIYEKNPSEGGLALQEIVSAFRKENDNTPRLKYWIFDVPKQSEPFSTRAERLQHINFICGQNNLESLKVVPTFQVMAEGDVLEHYNMFIGLDEEGAVVRNNKGLYEFGGRSYDAQKIKERSLVEARVVSYELDKNNEAVLHLVLENDVQFKAKALKSAEFEGASLRTQSGAEKVKGLFVEVEYENITLDGKPAKCIVQRVRRVDGKTWEPLE